MFSLVKSVLGNSVRTSKRAALRVRPVVECLEGRQLMDAAMMSSALGMERALPTDQFSAGVFVAAEGDVRMSAGIEDGSDNAMPDPDGDGDDQKPPAPPSPWLAAVSILSEPARSGQEDPGADSAAAAAGDDIAMAPLFDAGELVETSVVDGVLSGLPGYGTGVGGWLAEKIGEAAVMMILEAAMDEPDNGGAGGGEGSGPSWEGGGGSGPAGDDYTADDNTEDDADADTTDDTCDEDDGDDDDDDYPVPWEVLHEGEGM